jgi:hypothetical protein
MLLAASAFATSLVPVNLAQIVENTDKAFVGEVKSVEVVKTPKGWAEEVTVKVSDPVLGAVRAGETVSWLQYRVGEQARMPGMPKYATGEEHMIFLAGKGAGTDFQAAYGLGQGSFRVHRDKETGQAFVRNEFMNAQLFTGLDTDALSAAIVDQDAATRGLAADAKSAAAGRAKASLANKRMGATDIDGIKSAAKALSSKLSPSKAFAAPAGQRGSATTFVLQGHAN